MNKNKIIVRSESANLWWGIYGFCDKTGWEDLNLFYENEERIGGVCLNTKAYLRYCIEDLKDNPEEIDFVRALETYLADDKCHYWYYYDEKGDEDFYEVPYTAPINKHGVKPRFMDIWHPDEGIDLSTIKSAVKVWAKKHLHIENCEVVIDDIIPFEESLADFKEHGDIFRNEGEINVVFADELIEELSQLWNKPKEDVLKTLENSIK